MFRMVFSSRLLDLSSPCPSSSSSPVHPIATGSSWIRHAMLWGPGRPIEKERKKDCVSWHGSCSRFSESLISVLLVLFPCRARPLPENPCPRPILLLRANLGDLVRVDALLDDFIAKLNDRPLFNSRRKQVLEFANTRLPRAAIVAAMTVLRSNGFY